ncbi:sulfite exporter TauE/SafE family protein [Pseudonocardia sp. RS11V-5]|uniref:sulfite exporter TauE/SafE family protein n=1 Tax=Pseudonocardia terrae TaxID=2905831 RepID=UPI001E28A606|nr:sulfite exporter TauE/SafE family protein [Pseudonocardia terrae]MCE3550205.1 sulfite exporter TauE/SafE family protein [Pseudonocardia terrae]
MLTTIAVLVGFGCLSGLTTVLFGFGGGFVTVPVVYAVAASGPQAMHLAVGTSTAVMVVNAAGGTLAQYRSGRLRRDYVWPLAGYVAIGAALGALAATAAPDGLLHVLFAVYLGLTIVDSLVRRGFLRGGVPRPLGARTASLGGVTIGAVASFLGVGGSVMTVPLLRRRGLPMAHAVAMANPLSLPVAVVATAVYLTVPAPDGSRGVDLLAGALLLAGSLPTIGVVRRLLPHVPDRVHAVAYVGLLVVALVAVLV